MLIAPGTGLLVDDDLQALVAIRIMYSNGHSSQNCVGANCSL